MAPKGHQEEKKKKVVEDKTFGMKNKSKSAKVQQFVKQLEASMKPSIKEQRLAEPSVKDRKAAEAAKQKELNDLFAVAIKQPKLPAGVDPKSVLCEFFRHNQCTKGFKCKYSHDLNVERKGPKIDLFTDQRDTGNAEDEEGMDDWDQETLEKVVKEKHANEKPSNATNIICKFFLEAVEKKMYGWFWKCPNGVDCKYRHALPPGYILKSQMKELLEEEARNVRDVADVIEEERGKVDGKTPINEEVFQMWRRKRHEDKLKKREDAAEERKRKGILTGREIFMQDGFTAEDDANANDEYDREDRVDEDKAIAEMMAQAKANAEAARAAQAVAEEETSAAGGTATATAGAAAAAGPSAAILQLADDEAEALFDDDDDDEDDEDEMLEELGQGIKAAGLGDGS